MSNAHSDFPAAGAHSQCAKCFKPMGAAMRYCPHCGALQTRSSQPDAVAARRKVWGSALAAVALSVLAGAAWWQFKQGSAEEASRVQAAAAQVGKEAAAQAAEDAASAAAGLQVSVRHKPRLKPPSRPGSPVQRSCRLPARRWTRILRRKKHWHAPRGLLCPSAESEAAGRPRRVRLRQL